MHFGPSAIKWKSIVQFKAVKKDFSLLQHIYTSSGMQLACQTMGVKDSFHRSGAPRV